MTMVFFEVLLDFLEFALDFDAREWIECTEWFVHQQNGWVSGERSRNADTLALPAGKLVGMAAQIFTAIQADQFQQFGDARTNAFFRPVFQTRHQGNVLFDRVMRKKANVLNDVADLPPQGDGIPIERRTAADAHLALAWFEHAIYQFERCGFSSTAAT